jgi:transcriptional regulator GlxA family with amidase domain
VTQTVLDRGTRYRTFSVGERTEPMDSNTPMAVIPEKRFEEVPDPFAIIVPGGGIASLEAMGNERILNYLRFAEHRAELVSSVSTGAFVLTAAGLLEGRQATTHPAYAELLKKLGVNYVQSYSVEDGKFLTMEGVSSGIDTMLQLVAKLRGEGAAKRAQNIIEYDPQPPFGGIDWSEANGEGLEDKLDEHRADLERALTNRPDLYQKLFS